MSAVTHEKISVFLLSVFLLFAVVILCSSLRAFVVYGNALEGQRFISLFREIYEISLSRKCIPKDFLNTVERHGLFQDSFDGVVHIDSVTSTSFVVTYRLSEDKFVLITADVSMEEFVVKNTIPQP